MNSSFLNDKDSNGSIESIANRSSEISNITKVIADIASQTHLLAINAAIQASHAQQYGEGFAIVSKEISKLAELTRTSAHEIESLLDKVRNDTDLIISMKTQNKEQKDLLETIKDQNLLFGKIINELEDKIEVKDPDGRYYLMNIMAAKDYHMKVDQLIGKSVFDFYDNETAQGYFDTEANLVQSRRSEYSLERVQLQLSDKYLFINKTPILLPEYNDWGLLVIQREIEESQIHNSSFLQKIQEKYAGVMIRI